MSNSIRQPKRGVTANSKRIAEAVDNQEWQEFRLSMKGKSTSEKLDMLEQYYDQQGEIIEASVEEIEVLRQGTPMYEEYLHKLEDVKIRIDNYIKSLCRGGQLEAGMTFDHFSDGCIRNHIKK